MATQMFVGDMMLSTVQLTLQSKQHMMNHAPNVCDLDYTSSDPW